MIVLPWPGESAWATPSPKASSSDPISRPGLSPPASMMPARSLPTPPGTAPSKPMDVCSAAWFTPTASGVASGAVHAGQSRAAGFGLEGHRPNVERLGQEVGGIACQPGGAPSTTAAAVARTVSPRPHDDLAPADPLGERAVRKADLLELVIGDPRIATYSHTTRMVESPPAPAGKDTPAASWRGLPGAADREVKLARKRAAGGLALRLDLRSADVSVAVDVEPLALLEGGDLCPIDHHVERDPVAGNADPGVVVDGEIAERMGCRNAGTMAASRQGEERATASAAATVRSWQLPEALRPGWPTTDRARR